MCVIVVVFIVIGVLHKLKGGKMKVKDELCPACGRKGIQYKQHVSLTHKGTTHQIKRCHHCRKQL